MNIARASYTYPMLTLKIWDVSETPSTEVYSKVLFLKDLQANSVNDITLDSVIKVTGNFFIGYAVRYDVPGDGFALYHAPSRGKTGASSMYVFTGAWNNINSTAR